MTEPRIKLPPGPGRRWKRWTVQERQELRRLLELGHTYAAVASALGRTGKAVEKFVSRHGSLIWTTPGRETT